MVKVGKEEGSEWVKKEEPGGTVVSHSNRDPTQLSMYQSKDQIARKDRSLSCLLVKPGTDSSFSLTLPPASSYCSKLLSVAPVGTTPIWGSNLASPFKLEAPLSVGLLPGNPNFREILMPSGWAAVALSLHSLCSYCMQTIRDLRIERHTVSILRNCGGIIQSSWNR